MTTLVTFRALTDARDRGVRRGGRVGGPGGRLCDPGPRRGPGRADRRRLPERRRSAGRAARCGSCQSASSAIPAKTSTEPARRPRETCSASSGPRAAVAITTDDERTASTEAALPWRSASSPSVNEPTIRERRDADGPAELAPDRPRADERRIDQARQRERQHEVRQRAGVLDPDAVDERVARRSRPRVSRPTAARRVVAAARADARARRRRRRCSTPATSADDAWCPSAEHRNGEHEHRREAAGERIDERDLACAGSASASATT